LPCLPTGNDEVEKARDRGSEETAIGSLVSCFAVGDEEGGAAGALVHKQIDTLHARMYGFRLPGPPQLLVEWGKENGKGWGMSGEREEEGRGMRGEREEEVEGE